MRVLGLLGTVAITLSLLATPEAFAKDRCTDYIPALKVLAPHFSSAENTRGILAEAKLDMPEFLKFQTGLAANMKYNAGIVRAFCHQKRDKKLKRVPSRNQADKAMAKLAGLTVAAMRTPLLLEQSILGRSREVEAAIKEINQKTKNSQTRSVEIIEVADRVLGQKHGRRLEKREVDGR